jgi:hypothetical protein
MTDAALPPIDQFRASFTEVTAPPEDRAISPYTGLTREHWAAYADDLLLAAARYRSPRGARIDLPGQTSQQGIRTDGLEGFARTFLLAAFVHAGEGMDHPHDHLSRYLEGVVAGTRTAGRDDSESWPLIGRVGRNGQQMVEAASVALSMHLTKSDSWDALDGAEQDRLEAWLREALRHEPSSNNWYLFPTTVASFLEGVGRGDAETAFAIDRGLGLIEQWYRGEGWYSDGDGQAFDHYIGWALHLYPMLHAQLRGETELLGRLGKRLEEFLGSFALTFDRNGSPLYLGRSLTYRVATLASVALGATTGYTPLTPGQSRRVLSAALRYFAERGARSDGVYSLGWHGAHLPTLQRYSGPGSPYWASKGFLALSVASDHPVWTATEEELPAERANQIRSVGSAGLLVQVTRADGLVRVHNHGSDHLKPHEADAGGPDPLYARFAYSTRSGPTALHNPSDNDVQVRFEGVWSVRRRINMIGSGADWIASWHAPRFPMPAPFDASPYAASGPVLPSVRIDSVVAVRGRFEVRVHRLVNVPPGSAVRASGWTVAAARPDQLERIVDGVEVTLRRTGTDVLTSQLAGGRGWNGASIAIAPFGTAYGAWAEVPELWTTASDDILVSIASLTAEPFASALSDAVSVDVEGSSVRIEWGEGPLTEVDLDTLGFGG